MKSIEQGNKLIAEFDGYTYDPQKILNGQSGVFYKKEKMPLLIGQLKYHSSWDHLIPVCAKFDSLYVVNAFDVGDDRERYHDLSEMLDNSVTMYEIERAWVALVECIEWFNALPAPPKTEGQ